MRPVTKLFGAVALLALGVVAGRFLFLPEMPERTGLFADKALARAVIDAGAMDIAQSDCVLSTGPEGSPTVSDFVLDYAAAAELPPGKASFHSECGGRGKDKCSVSYSLLLGEKADTNILMFSRDQDGNLVPEDVTCLSQ